jgi:uncharacterized protein (DUF2235 family)
MPEAVDRKLIIGFDGTWNEAGKEKNDPNADPDVDTNVVKIMRALASVGGRQVQHYEEGVGTRAWEALPGGVYGYGLDKRVMGGYRFLRKRFRDRDWQSEQNKIFIYGFSRGSYTARRLSGLLAHSGLPVNARDDELGMELYLQNDSRSAEQLKKEGRFIDVPVEMIGVWDTVKATNDADCLDSILRANVAAGYHAMAIDERRKFFPVLRWNKNARVREVWFAGVHSDVGGGYEATGLSDIAFRWMLKCSLRHGLQFKAKYVKENVKPNPAGKIHESFRDIWVPLGSKSRPIRPNDLVHPAVARRMKAREKYRPENLPSDPNYDS